MGGFGDFGEHGALFNAIAAPYAAENQYVHLACEACEQLCLCICQGKCIVDIFPSFALARIAGSEVLVIWQCLRKNAIEIFSI